MSIPQQLLERSSSSWSSLGYASLRRHVLILTPGEGSLQEVAQRAVASSRSWRSHVVHAVWAIATALVGMWGYPPSYAFAQEALAEDHQVLESELFGASSTVASDLMSRTSSTAAAQWLQDPPAVTSDTPGQLLQALEDRSERIVFGGELYLRLTYVMMESGAPESFPISSPNTIDLYLDAQPIEGMRTYARVRGRYDPTMTDEGVDNGSLEDGSDSLGMGDGRFVSNGGQARSPTSLQLDQLWLKYVWDHRIFLTLGKQRVRWGTGRIWNPTDFLNDQRFDPLALFDARLGVGLVKVHIPFERQGINVYSIVNVEGAESIDEIGLAVRGEIARGSMELALSATAQQDRPLRLGFDLSLGVGSVDIRSEMAVLRDELLPTISGQWSANDPLDFSQVRVRYADAWKPQIVLGMEGEFSYRTNRQMIFGLEYFYNHLGYSDASLYPILLLTPALATFDSIGLGLKENSRSPFQPLYLGRHYGAAYILLPQLFGYEDQTWILTGIVNFSDETGVVRVEHQMQLNSYLRLQSYLNAYVGSQGEFRFGLTIPAIDRISPQPIEVKAAQLALGIAVSVSI